MGISPIVGWGPAGSPTFREWRQLVSEKHAPSTRGCFSRGPFNQRYIDACTWSFGATGRPLYLVGDSTAWQYSEALIGAGSTLHRPVSVVTTSSCPLIQGLHLEVLARSEFVPGSVRLNEFEHCDAYINSTLAWLRQSRPGTVFIAALDQYWWDPTVGAAIGQQELTGDEAEKLAQVKAGMSLTVRLLQSTGHRVVLIQAIPTYRNPPPIWDPRTCTYAALLSGRCNREVPLGIIDEIQRPTREAIAEVAIATGAEVLDLQKRLCSDDTCSTDRGGVPQYMDATHLNVNASRALANAFSDAALAAR